MRAALVLLALLPVPAVGRSQSVADIETFASSVREATRRYQDQAAAIADGYRRVGPDFPSMGEHWISVPLIVSGIVDPLRPAILEYVSMAGRPVLAGVAYTQLVRDRAPDAVFPAPAAAWHYHSGTVDEESFVLGHADPGIVRSADSARIAVLHAWVWLSNPAGLFATDNWALPYLRLGLTPPSRGPEPSSPTLAVALAAHGEGYFGTLLRLRHELPAEPADRVTNVLREHASRLRQQLQADRGGGPSASDLARAWAMVEADIQAVCGECSPWPGH